mmetsp:Transcript_22006/g.43746  ORF Transcript_22006/g.43746 Transcript_22006/m.43746 type:complete len:101 (-) Transcript_22006:282-584(-)
MGVCSSNPQLPSPSACITSSAPIKAQNDDDNPNGSKLVRVASFSVASCTESGSTPPRHLETPSPSNGTIPATTERARSRSRSDSATILSFLEEINTAPGA